MNDGKSRNGWQLLARWMVWMTLALLAACGSDGDDTPAAEVVVAPAITAQPADTQVTAGGSARFSVTVDGTGLVYQWQRSNDAGSTWADIAGASTASYTLAAPTVADSGSRFRVLVSRGTVQTISSPVTLTVSALVVAPGITVQPQPAQVTEGGNASFSVTATGSTLAYRWQTSSNGTDWADAAGGTTPSLTLNAVPLSSNQQLLRVLVSNSLGSVTSDPVRLTVLALSIAPAFTTQPLAAAVVAPATATLSVAATGTPAPTLQWQRSSDGGSTYTNIAGATAASYTTGATSVADNGTRYRAVASNSTATATSAAATLTVAAAPLPPAWTSQPADASVMAGAQVTFSAAASGNPAPTLQWQISTDGGATFANINGATGGSYMLTAGTADNGRRFRVVASNSQASITSTAALLTVASSSVLSGRGWTSGQSLDTSLLVQTGGSVMDNQGRLTVAYSKIVVDRVVLYVARGTPGAAGTAPVFGTPLALEAGAVGLPIVAPLAVSPNGNVAVAWTRSTSCGGSTCYSFMVARYMAATGSWDTAVPVGDQTQLNLATINPTVSINDAGDLLLLSTPTVYWRANGATAFSSQSWPLALINANDPYFLPTAATLDNAGRIVVAGQRLPGNLVNVYDVAVYRGNVTAGLGAAAAETIDQRGSAVVFHALYTNPAGQSVLLWGQDNGARSTVYAATVDTAGGAWSLTDTGQTPPTTTSIGVGINGALADDGSFIWYFYGNCAALRRSAAGTWSAPAALPSTLCLSGAVPGTPTLARNGNLVTLHPTDGSWVAYDAKLDQVFNPFPHSTASSSYLLGFGRAMSGLPGTLLLSSNGVGAYVGVNTFSVLPTAALPNGDTGQSRLWAWFFK